MKIYIIRETETETESFRSIYQLKAFTDKDEAIEICNELNENQKEIPYDKRLSYYVNTLDLKEKKSNQWKIKYIIPALFVIDTDNKEEAESITEEIQNIANNALTKKKCVLYLDEILETTKIQLESTEENPHSIVGIIKL